MAAPINRELPQMFLGIEEIVQAVDESWRQAREAVQALGEQGVEMNRQLLLVRDRMEQQRAAALALRRKQHNEGVSSQEVIAFAERGEREWTQLTRTVQGLLDAPEAPKAALTHLKNECGNLPARFAEMQVVVRRHIAQIIEREKQSAERVKGAEKKRKQDLADRQAAFRLQEAERRRAQQEHEDHQAAMQFMQAERDRIEEVRFQRYLQHRRAAIELSLSRSRWQVPD